MKRKFFSANLVFCVFLLAALAFGGGTWAHAEEPDLKLPRFVTLGKDEIFVRTGPSIQYPIKWVYQKRGLPVEIVREYDTWRQIKDYDGASGWVHHAMLSGYRSVIIQAKDGVTLLSESRAGSSPVVHLDQGVVASIEKCAQEWCRLHISGFKGWALRAALWGVYPSEEIN